MLFGFRVFKFWILNFKIWTIKKNLKTENLPAIFDNSNFSTNNFGHPKCPEKECKMALEKISVAVTKETITGYQQMAKLPIFDIKKSKNSSGKEKIEYIERGSIVEYFLTRVHGGASDKNLIILFGEYVKNGSPVKVMRSALEDWIRQCDKLSTTKSYSPMVVKMDSAMQSFINEGMDMLKICNADVELSRQTMYSFARKDIFGGVSDKNVAFLTYAYAMHRETFDKKESKTEAKMHSEGKDYTKRSYEDVHFIEGALKHDTYKDIIEKGAKSGYFKLK